MGVDGSVTAVPTLNSRKPRLMFVAASRWPSRYSSGSRTSMTTTFSPDARRRWISAGPSSGTTCLASESISFRVFMGPILPPFPVDSREIAPRAPSLEHGTAAILSKIHGEFYKGDHPRRRLGYPPLSSHARDEQAARADLQQAHDLLPALDAHARGDPSHPGHHDAAGPERVPAAARRRQLHVGKLGRGIAWLDTGTHEALLQASTFIQTIEERQGLMVACVEEIAYRMGYITADDVVSIAKPMRDNSYGQYLLRLVETEP